MKRKVKKYAGGTLVDSSGNPVRSGSGDVIRTRSDDEIAEDMKRPMGQSMPRSSRSSSKEDRPTSSGVEDYSSMGKRAGATSTWSGAPTIKEETTTETETPTAPSARTSDEESVAGKGARNLALEEPEVKVKRKTVIKKEEPKYKDTGAKIGSQSFAMPKSEESSSTLSGAKTRAGTSARTPEIMGVGRTRAGTVVRDRAEPNKEDVDKAMSSLAERIRKQDQENTFKLTPTKNPNRSYKSGGKISKMAKGGSASTASSRGDGIAQRGKTRGRIC